jgi:hypothetical protein
MGTRLRVTEVILLGGNGVADVQADGSDLRKVAESLDFILTRDTQAPITVFWEFPLKYQLLLPR